MRISLGESCAIDERTPYDVSLGKRDNQEDTIYITFRTTIENRISFIDKRERATMAQVLDISVQYITNESGEKISVVLPIEKYQRMLEDLHDLTVIAERKDEGTISFAQIKKQFLSV